jgi:hypothetical protein
MQIKTRIALKAARLFVAQSIWAGLTWWRFRSFRKATYCVEQVQHDILLRILRRNASTAFGKQHNFETVESVDDFRSQVKLSTYDDYLSAINAIASGESSVLTSDPVLMLEPSSGSTASSKFIPYTQSLRDEFKSGLAPWLFDLFTKRPKLLSGSAYWSISPNTPKDWPGSKVPIGFGDDAGYFGAFEQRLIYETLAVPAIVAKIEDVEAYRYVTLLFLLRDRHLSFISVWNPTFLSLLMAPLSAWMTRLIGDIRDGTISSPGLMGPELQGQLIKKCFPDPERAKYLEDVRRADNLHERIWPKLCLISCWADGHAGQSIGELKKLFPNVEIQPKGLLATEGIVSFPLIGKKGAALSIGSHFFEFVELDEQVEGISNSDRIKLAHQLEEGKRYSVVITTGGGLYRYQLQDIVQVVGFEEQCPFIQFISKEFMVSDIAGEKLNEFHVAMVLKEELNRHVVNSDFYLMAPEEDKKTGKYGYVLFLEISLNGQVRVNVLNELIENVEKRLEENYHYAHCVRLGQLLPIRVSVIKDSGKARQAIIRRLCAEGQRIGQIKPFVLSRKTGWSDFFGD